MEKKSKKNIIAIIMVLIVIIGCGLAYAYTKTDIFKTPQQLFKKYLADNVNQLENMNFNPLAEILEKMENEPVETNLYVDVESQGETISVVVNSKADVKNQKSYSSLKVNNGEKQYFNLEALLSDEKFGIQIDELHDKYLALENRDLKKIAQTIGLDEETITEIPDKLEIMDNTYSEEDEQKAKILKNKYFEKLNNQISEEKYQAEKNVLIQVNGKELKTNKYTLTLGNKELLKISNDIFTELLNDSDFIELYEKTGNTISIDELKEKLIVSEDEIEEMEDTEIKISVYANNSKTVKTEITSGDDFIEFFIDNSSNESTMALVFNDAKDEDTEIGQKITVSLNNKYEDSIGTMTMQIANEYNKKDIETQKSNVDEHWSDYYNDEYYTENYKDQSYSIVITTEKTDENNMILKVSTEDINKLLEDEESVKLTKCELVYNFNKELNIPDFSDENSLILNDYTEKEFEKLVQDILKNAYNNSDEYPDSIVSLLVNYYIYMTQLNQANVLTEPNLDAGYYNQ